MILVASSVILKKVKRNACAGWLMSPTPILPVLLLGLGKGGPKNDRNGSNAIIAPSSSPILLKLPRQVCVVL